MHIKIGHSGPWKEDMHLDGGCGQGCLKSLEGGWGGHNQNILWACMKFSKNGCFQKDCVLLSLWVSGLLPCRTFSRIGVYNVCPVCMYGPVWMAQATGEYRAPSVASGCDHCNHSQPAISALDKLTQSLLMCRSGWLVKGGMGILEASVCWFWCYDACREAESRHLPLGIFQHTGALAFIRASFWPGLTHSPPPCPTLLLSPLPRWPFSSNCTPCEFISPWRQNNQGSDEVRLSQIPSSAGGTLCTCSSSLSCATTDLSDGYITIALTQGGITLCKMAHLHSLRLSRQT